MAKMAEVKIFDNSNDNTKWELEKELEYQPLWDLAHGENPHQSAGILKTSGMADFEIIGDANLSYNDVINISELSNILSEFYDVCAVAIVRDSAICGVALAPDIEAAYNKAFDCDPMSSFFGAIGFSQKVTYEVAKHINSMSVKLIIAPEIEEDGLKLLKENKFTKVVLIKTPFKEFKHILQKEIKITPFGTLYQDINHSTLGKDSFNVVTKTKPTTEQIEDAVFAWKISKYARSNSIIIAKDFKTEAIAQGFASPVNAVEFAMNTACDGAKNAILASDNTIPSIDCIYAAAQGRISTIIQPGGADNENKIIELADKYNIAMILTGIKNYKH